MHMAPCTTLDSHLPLQPLPSLPCGYDLNVWPSFRVGREASQEGAGLGLAPCCLPCGEGTHTSLRVKLSLLVDGPGYKRVFLLRWERKNVGSLVGDGPCPQDVSQSLPFILSLWGLGL